MTITEIPSTLSSVLETLGLTNTACEWSISSNGGGIALKLDFHSTGISPRSFSQIRIPGLKSPSTRRRDQLRMQTYLQKFKSPTVSVNSNKQGEDSLFLSKEQSLQRDVTNNLPSETVSIREQSNVQSVQETSSNSSPKFSRCVIGTSSIGVQCSPESSPNSAQYVVGKVSNAAVQCCPETVSTSVQCASENVSVGVQQNQECVSTNANIHINSPINKLATTESKHDSREFLTHSKDQERSLMAALKLTTGRKDKVTERVIKRRITPQGKEEYLIKWCDHKPSENKWIRTEKLDLIAQEYITNNQHKIRGSKESVPKRQDFSSDYKVGGSQQTGTEPHLDRPYRSDFASNVMGHVSYMKAHRAYINLLHVYEKGQLPPF